MSATKRRILTLLFIVVLSISFFTMTPFAWAWRKWNIGFPLFIMAIVMLLAVMVEAYLMWREYPKQDGNHGE